MCALPALKGLRYTSRRIVTFTASLLSSFRELG
jgi:hypothetical protein